MTKQLPTTYRSRAGFQALNNHHVIKNTPVLHPREYRDATADLLADLMLWSEDDEFFEQCLSTARLHYYAEKGEQQ